MKRMSVLTVLLTVGALCLPGGGPSNCQMPRGIYEDGARIDMLEEYIITIGKSME